jgi:NADH dehydrogenase FAD-containing subunit
LEAGDIASSELSNLIHKFHQGRPRELFVKYNTNHLEAPLTHAIVTGVLDKDKIPPELLEHLAASIKFYADREVAGDMQEDDIPEDDEDSGSRRK